MSTERDPQFTSFIISLLKRGNMKDEFITRITSEKYMSTYLMAFTHKSFDIENNWELPELVGDSVVNYSIMKYLRKKFPKIVSVKYLTKLKHNICSKKELALMAESAGFWQFIRMSPEYVEKFNGMNLERRHKDATRDGYMSFLEDTFEAFLGTTAEIIEEEMNVEGLGTQICYRIIKSFLDELDISLDYDVLFDAKTRFKELCDRRGWEFKTCMEIIENKEPIPDVEDKFKRTYIVNMYGYPYGDKTKSETNREKLSTYTSNLKSEAEQNAAERALTKLFKKFQIYDTPPDPYRRIN